MMSLDRRRAINLSFFVLISLILLCSLEARAEEAALAAEPELEEATASEDPRPGEGREETVAGGEDATPGEPPAAEMEEQEEPEEAAQESPPSHRVSGGTLNIPEGERVKDVVVFGGAATIGEDVVVHGDVVAFGGSTNVGKGVRITGDVVTFGGSISLGSDVRVEGDAVAIGGAISVREGSEIAGDAVTLGGSVSLEEGAVVGGTQTSIGFGRAVREAFDHGAFEKSKVERRSTPAPVRFLHRMSMFLATFAFGLIALAVMPRRMPRMGEALTEQIPQSILAGLLVFIAFVPLVVLLAVTIVGILLIPLLFIAYAVLLFVGWAAAGLALGSKLPNGEERTPIVNLAIGLAVFAGIAIISLVPFIGWISTVVLIIATLAGVGATITSRFGRPEVKQLPPEDGDDEASSAEVGEGRPI